MRKLFSVDRATEKTDSIEPPKKRQRFIVQIPVPDLYKETGKPAE